MLGLGAAGIVWGSRAQDFMEKALAPVTSRDGTGLSSFLPTGQFRIYTVTGGLPSRARDKYTLKVGGLVDKPFTLNYEQLTSMPPTHLTRDFQCVTGWRVPDVKWTGVQLSHLLDQAGVKPGAGAVKFTSFDGVYTESLTMDQARRPDV